MMHGKPVVILLVDDDSSHAEAIARAFLESDSNLRFRTAGTLRECRAAMAEDPPDIAIVDHGILDPGAQFIGKPFSMTAVQQKVREVLDSGQ